MELEANSGQHQAGKSDKVEAGQRGRQPLVISGQPSEAGGPGKRSFPHPAAGQEHEAPFGLGQFDHFELHPEGSGGRCRVLARVALVNVSQFHRFTCDRPDGLDQFAHLDPVVPVGGRHAQGQQMPQGVHRHVHFSAPVASGPVVVDARAAGQPRQRAQVVPTLAAIFGKQGKVRRHQGPFFIGKVALVRFA